MRQDVLVVPHGGGPMPLLDEPSHAGMVEWLQTTRARLPRPPTAILVISAHWEAPVATVQSGSAPSLLYDYHGFPRQTYQLDYRPKGAPELAARVQGLLAQSGIKSSADGARGFDHGVFVPLMFMCPDADVPVMQLSLLASLDAREHVRLGAALAPLRDEGVLLVGSGMHSFHNMRGFAPPGAPLSELGQRASAAFDAWLAETVLLPADARNERLASWDSLAPRAREAHPREEHLLPLMVAAGAAGSSRAVVELQTEIMGTKASGYVFTDAAQS